MGTNLRCYSSSHWRNDSNAKPGCCFAAALPHRVADHDSKGTERQNVYVS